VRPRGKGVDEETTSSGLPQWQGWQAALWAGIGVLGDAVGIADDVYPTGAGEAPYTTVAEQYRPWVTRGFAPGTDSDRRQRASGTGWQRREIGVHGAPSSARRGSSDPRLAIAPATSRIRQGRTLTWTVPHHHGRLRFHRAFITIRNRATAISYSPVAGEPHHQSAVRVRPGSGAAAVVPSRKQCAQVSPGSTEAMIGWSVSR